MTETDATLVERARSGDGAAFEALVRRHLRTAYLAALSVLTEPADAEDACQDAFVTALEKLDDCRNPDRFLPWLLQIVRNRARSLHRYHQVRRTLPLEDVVTRADGGGGPVRDAERAELRASLLDGLSDLNEVQREVVLLHDLEGWKHREISSLLDLPEGTVRSHLFHARRKLRERLSRQYSEGY